MERNSPATHKGAGKNVQLQHAHDRSPTICTAIFRGLGVVSLWLLPSAAQAAAAKHPEAKASDKVSKLSGQPSQSTESEISEHEAGKTAPGQSVFSLRFGRTPAGGNAVLPKRMSACGDATVRMLTGSPREVVRHRPCLVMRCATI